MTEIQQITLRDVLRQEGLSERSIEDIFLLLRFKTERAQMIFYYAAQGWTQSDIGYVVGMSQAGVKYYIDNSLTDLRLYLMEKSAS